MAWQDAGGFGINVESERLCQYLVVPFDGAKCWLTDIKYLFDFKDEMCNLGLVTLHGP